MERRSKFSCSTIVIGIAVFIVIIFIFRLLYLSTSSSYQRMLVHRCKSSHRKRKVTFKENDVINPHFTYSINAENACSLPGVQVIVPVHSAVTNFNRRKRTRKFKQASIIHYWSISRVVFFVGLPSEQLNNSQQFQKRLQAESDEHRDIVQINLIDVYKNIAFKALAVLQWLDTYCSNNTDFVIKMDDDVIVDPLLLLTPLYRMRTLYSEFVMGELRTNRKPEFEKDVKWRLELEEYTQTTFPPFVMGAVYAYPISTGRIIYQQALRLKLLRLDDVFFTGICTQILGIPVLHNDHFSHVHKPMKTKNFVFKTDREVKEGENEASVENDFKGNENEIFVENDESKV